MTKLKLFLQTRPIFLFLLPVFFVFHGFVENFYFIPISEAMLLVAVYLAAALCFSLLFWLLFRDFYKANLLAFYVFCIQLFFGAVHDILKRNFPGTVIIKYSFLIPLILVFFCLLIIVLIKMRRPLLKITQYLNTLLLLILLIDMGWLVSKIFISKKNISSTNIGLSNCGTCAKPDIYFILLDEYAGSAELRDLFHFDNSVFEDQLKKKGFYVVRNSFSNYNYTPFSLASILNMDYLNLKDTNRTGIDLTYSYQLIKNSRVIKFFQGSGYKFYNNSVFDFEHQPAPARETFLPVRTRLITSQTLLSRVQRDLWFNTVTLLKSKKSIRDLTYFNQKNNKHLYELTWAIAQQKTEQPKFIYTHLMMPHYPYYFDRNGNELPFDRLVEGNQVRTNDYIEYLQYSNKKIMDLVDHILHSSSRLPIIVLMGDHGFRHFNQAVERRYHFMNLSTIYFPDGNYAAFSDSMSSVNLFRKVLNSQFSQHLLMLKDSTIYLRD